MNTLSGAQGRTLAIGPHFVSITDKRGNVRTNVPRAKLTGVDLQEATWTKPGHLRLLHDYTTGPMHAAGSPEARDDADTVTFTKDKNDAFRQAAFGLGWTPTPVNHLASSPSMPPTMPVDFASTVPSSSVPSSSEPSPPVYSSAGSHAAAGQGKPAWYRRTWVMVAAAAVVGIALGSAAAGSEEPAPEPTDSAEYKDLAADFDAQTAELEEAQEEVRSIAGDLPEREDAVAAAQAELQAREEAVSAAETEVSSREAAVTVTETEIAAGTIEGEGLYEVGVDILAGTYKTTPTNEFNCYYAVLNSSDTFDIESNNNTTGQATVALSDGDFFESSGCAEWVRQ